MKKYRYIFLIIIFLFMLPAAGQDDPGLEKEALFDSDDPLEMTLSFDIRDFKRKKYKDEYLKAEMTYKISDNDSVTRQIMLKSRGEFRRGYCNFPPIRLNLKKNELPDDIFGGIDKIKMVTHCEYNKGDYILREYLVYKLYSVISDISFKVKLLDVTYIDTRKPDKPLREYAFLIEPVEFLTERTNSLEIESERLSQKNMKPDYINRIALFNYMIGNYDWTVPRLHNLIVLSKPLSENAGLGIPVPYDFDYSGLVNTSYSIPPEDAPIESVRDRLYLGLCRTEEEFINLTGHFLEKKDQLFSVIEDFSYLRERSKKEMINYLDSFFEDFDKRNTIVRKLLNECRD